MFLEKRLKAASESVRRLRMRLRIIFRGGRGQCVGRRLQTTRPLLLAWGTYFRHAKMRVISNVRSVPALGSVFLIVLSGCSGARAPGAPVPAVSVGAGASSVVEGTALQFTLRAAPAPAVDLAVTVNLVETGAVLAGPLSRTVTIRAGSDVAPLTVDTIDDQVDEPDSTVTATLAGGTGYALGAVASASVVVTDDDEPEPPAASPLVTISAVAAAVTEGAAVEFRLHAQPAPASELVVNVAVTESGAMLAAAPPRMVTIVAGAGTATLTLPTVDDAEDEPPGTVTAKVSAGAGYTLGSDTSASVTVVDDDEPPVPEVTIAVAASSVTEGMAAEFTLSADPAAVAELAVGVTLTVTGSASSAARTRAAHTVTVPPGDSITAVTVTIATGAGAARLTVATAGDDVDGPDRTLTASVTAGSGYTLGSMASASVTVRDDDEPTEPEQTVGFAYVAYDLTGLNGNELATEAAPEVVLTGTLPIPFADPVVLGAVAASGTEAAVPGTVTQGQCVPMVSAPYPTRYAALAGSGIDYRIDLQGDHDTSSHLFAVDFAEDMAFSGMPNVPAGDYSYVLEAAAGMQRASRAWKLAVGARDLPGESADDDREHDLHGDVAVDAEIEEAADGIAGDWADFVPENFATADDTSATVMNIPRLALPGTVADPVGLSLDASINGAGDVDMFWLGALSPNWRLELKVVGGAKQLALFRLGSVDPVPFPAAADSSYPYQVGGPQGGLSCADYYLRVSGNAGQYRLAWRLTRPQPQ